MKLVLEFVSLSVGDQRSGLSDVGDTFYEQDSIIAPTKSPPLLSQSILTFGYRQRPDVVQPIL